MTRLCLRLARASTSATSTRLTIDDRDLDETMHGLIQDVEGGYIHKLAFVAPGRMAWPLPLYELALMTAGRAYDMDIELETTIVTPEDSPLAIFGASASSAVAELLARANVETITSAYAEVPSAREVVINPGDRHLEVDRVIALPELFGPRCAASRSAITASSKWTRTAGYQASSASTRPATQPTSPSSTAASARSRLTLSRSRSRRWPGLR